MLNNSNPVATPKEPMLEETAPGCEDLGGS
jgi:hypothetical protein